MKAYPSTPIQDSTLLTTRVVTSGGQEFAVVHCAPVESVLVIVSIHRIERGEMNPFNCRGSLHVLLTDTIRRTILDAAQGRVAA